MQITICNMDIFFCFEHETKWYHFWGSKCLQDQTDSGLLVSTDCGLRFVNTTAWKLQAFPEGSLPEAIPESDYVCPSAGLQSNDQRRNWTDYQETAQWLGGIDMPKKMLDALGLGGPRYLGLKLILLNVLKFIFRFRFRFVFICIFIVLFIYKFISNYKCFAFDNLSLSDVCPFVLQLICKVGRRQSCSTARCMMVRWSELPLTLACQRLGFPVI